MADNVIVSPLTNLEGSSAVQKVNENFNKLAEAFDKVLWKDGKEEVDNDLDLNGRKILNVGDPVEPTDLVRVKDLSGLISDVVFSPIRSNSFNSVVELAASNVENISAVLAEEGKAGTFTIRDYADFIDEVAADTSQVNFIRSNSDPSKVWVRTTILDFGASQVGTSSGSNVQDELDTKLGVGALTPPAGPWGIIATAGQTDFDVVGSEDYEIVVRLNGQPLTETIDYSRTGDVVTLLVPTSEDDAFEASAIRGVDQIAGISLRASGVGAVDEVGAETNVQTELVKNATSITVIKDSRPVNLLDYCTSNAQRAAVLAGTVGIDVPLALAIPAAAAVKRPILLPPGSVFTTTPGATISNPTGVPIYGNNSTIRKIGNGPLFRTGTTDDPAMNGARLVDGILPRGSTVIPVLAGSTGQFSVGQWVVITDRTSTQGGGGNNRRGEIHRIQAIDAVASTITLWAPTTYEYLGGAVGGGYARIVNAPLVSGACYKDMIIEMDDSIAAVTGDDAFACRWLLAPTFDNIIIRNFVQNGFRFENCLGWTVDNARFVVGGSATSADGTSSEGLTGYSYGVCEVGACSGGIISNSTAINIRHFYTTVATASTGGVPSDYGQPTGTKIVGCTSIFPKNAGFDTHEHGRDIQFLDCTVIGGHHVGLQVRAPGTVVKNFTCIDTLGCAVWIRGGATGNTYAADTIIDNVVARRTNLGVDFSGTDWREFGAVMDEASYTRGGRVYAQECGGPALMMYRNGGNNNGSWDRIEAVNVCELAQTNRFAVYVASGFSGVIDIHSIHHVNNRGRVVNALRGAGTLGTVRNREIYSSGHTGALTLMSGGMTLADSLPNITGLQAKIDDFETRISALEVA